VANKAAGGASSSLLAASKKPAAKKARPKPAKPVAEVDSASSAESHISPEEAVAHIQALLHAKQERIKQGPTWPGATTSAPHNDNELASGHNDNHSHNDNHVADTHYRVPLPRGDQGKK
jgi:hypothetical protein